MYRILLKLGIAKCVHVEMLVMSTRAQRLTYWLECVFFFNVDSVLLCRADVYWLQVVMFFHVHSLWRCTQTGTETCVHVQLLLVSTPASTSDV